MTVAFKDTHKEISAVYIERTKVYPKKKEAYPKRTKPNQTPPKMQQISLANTEMLPRVQLDQSSETHSQLFSF